MLNLKTIAAAFASLAGFILAPSQVCIAESANQICMEGLEHITLNQSRSTVPPASMHASTKDGSAAGPYADDRSNVTDESGESSEGASGVRIELVPHLTDGNRNIYIKMPFLYEEGPPEGPESLWVRRPPLPGLEDRVA